jgi:dCMP deaminase
MIQNYVSISHNANSKEINVWLVNPQGDYVDCLEYFHGDDVMNDAINWIHTNGYVIYTEITETHTDRDMRMYMGFADIAAKRSYAKRLKVGAVLVNQDHIMVMGYNGTPPGWDNVCEDENDNTKPEVRHAELNAIFKFAKAGIPTKGSVLYLTHSPCMPCAQAIELAQISKVVYRDVYRCDKGIVFLKKAGIEIININ